MATSSGVANGAAEMGDEPGLAPPIVSAEEFHRRAAANVHARAREAHLAFYSSWTDCITTDPAAMVLPMDDHMAHRGHGVFDTAHLHAGHLHMLDRHVSRFFKSMRAANIPPPFDRRVVTSLILRVAAAGGSREGQLRFYASAGPGGFALDQTECVKSVFYCVAVKKRRDAEKTNASRSDGAARAMANDAASARRGVAVVTSSVPIKPPAFATVKSTNYLPNALVVADAKRRGAQYGIWLTEDGKHVAEGPSMNVGFVVRSPRAFLKTRRGVWRRKRPTVSETTETERRSKTEWKNRRLNCVS
jgi:4-amino-4-deoxychorismate lyase